MHPRNLCFKVILWVLFAKPSSCCSCALILLFSFQRLCWNVRLQESFSLSPCYSQVGGKRSCVCASCCRFKLSSPSFNKHHYTEIAFKKYKMYDKVQWSSCLYLPVDLQLSNSRRGPGGTKNERPDHRLQRQDRDSRTCHGRRNQGNRQASS